MNNAQPNILVKYLSKKIGGYTRRMRHDYAMWSHRRLQCANADRYERWINHLRGHPPEVFLGPDLPYGGVREHVRAIRKYSNRGVTLVPDEVAMGGLDRFNAEAREKFLQFDPVGSPCVHSNVIPWMIDWCYRQKGRGCRWVHTHHNWYYPEFSRGELGPWQIEFNERFLFAIRNADVALSVSKWQRDFLLREHGAQTAYLPNGVDVEACDRGSGRRFRCKTRVREAFVLYVGRNDPVKNPAEFVRLASLMPRLQFVMIGGGLSVEVLRKDWNEECPANLSVFDSVTHQQVQDAIAACSALVVTSKREGLPTLVMEGMAHRKSVVVPDESGCMEAVGGGEFGFVYRLGDVADLAAKLEVALSDHLIGSKARRRVLEEYDWRVVAPKLDAVYQGTDPHSGGLGNA